MALAGLACLLATGCASSGPLGLGGGRQAGYVTASRSASRPTITRDFRKPGPDLGVQLAAFNAGCGMCDECTCGCPVDGCGAGCGDPYGCGGACRGLIDGIAGGFCKNHGPGGYPEYPAFNQGPPVGQVAYPYYTVRGPRDFLRNKPPTIGPY
jgi:hypothetical protein